MQPLFQQKSCRSTIQFPASIAFQAKLLGSRPTGGELVDPHQRQLQAPSPQKPPQEAAVAKAVTGLGGELLGGIQGKAHHQELHLAAEGQGRKGLGILLRAPALEGRKGGHREAEGVTARQADALAAHIQGKGGAGGPWGHSALPDGGGHGTGSRFPLVEHGFQPEGGLAGGLHHFLSTPDGAGHEELFPQEGGPEALQPGATGVVLPVGTHHKGGSWLGQPMQQPGAGRPIEVVPTGLQTELSHQAHLGMVGVVTNRRHGFIPAAIHQKPAGSTGLIQQIVDPSIEHLAQVGGAAGLL